MKPAKMRTVRAGARPSPPGDFRARSARMSFLLITLFSLIPTASSNRHPPVGRNGAASRLRVVRPSGPTSGRLAAQNLRIKSNPRENKPAILRRRTAEVDVDSLTDLSEGFGDMTGNERFDRWWNNLFRKKDRIRCPFWRRRAADSLDAVLAVGRFVLARHKRLDVQPVTSLGVKTVGLDTAAVRDLIEGDFRERNYYVTGRLSRRVYADDCYFNSPDPDTPVVGLRKYVDAISHLFEQKSSRVELLEIEILDSDHILARWRLEGTLMLPWRPTFKAYTGSTVYTLNEERLVSRHEENWSITALDAFVSTLFPDWPLAAKSAPPAEVLRQQEGCGAPDYTSLLAKRI